MIVRFRRFGTIPECIRRTNGQTDTRRQRYITLHRSYL